MTPRQRRIADHIASCRALGIHPSLRQTGAHIGVSHTTAAREIATMLERGEIEVERAPGGSGAIRYRVTSP